MITTEEIKALEAFFLKNGEFISTLITTGMASASRVHMGVERIHAE